MRGGFIAADTATKKRQPLQALAMWATTACFCTKNSAQGCALAQFLPTVNLKIRLNIPKIRAPTATSAKKNAQAAQSAAKAGPMTAKVFSMRQNAASL